MLAVDSARYTGGYSIRLTFNNGREGVANLESTIFNDRRPIFSILKDTLVFQSFRVEHNTIIWSNELDLASEYLFFLAFKDDPELRPLFQSWGYIS